MRPGEPSVQNPVHIANPRSTMRIFRQPIHPMLVPVPIACFIGVLSDRPHLLVVGGHDVGEFFRVACDRRRDRRPSRRHFRTDRFSQQPVDPRPTTGVAARDRKRRAAHSRDAQHVRSFARRMDLGRAMGPRAFGRHRADHLSPPGRGDRWSIAIGWESLNENRPQTRCRWRLSRRRAGACGLRRRAFRYSKSNRSQSRSAGHPAIFVPANASLVGRWLEKRREAHRRPRAEDRSPRRPAFSIRARFTRFPTATCWSSN